MAVSPLLRPRMPSAPVRVARRHIIVTCPPQPVAIGPLLKGVILAFLALSQVWLGNSAALPSINIWNLITSYRPGEPLPSITGRTAGSLIISQCPPWPPHSVLSPEETLLTPKPKHAPAQLRPRAAAWQSDQGHHPYKACMLNQQ